MKKLLITGFESFGGENINPSWKAVERLSREIGEYSLTKLCLPVVFGLASKKVIELSAEIDPDVILCVGQAGGRSAITPELVGINLRNGSIPDNDGYKPVDEPIIPNGADAYFSSIPVRKISESISKEGIPSAVSYSAGTYVCNDVLYTLLAHFKNTKTRIGFIHVPYSEEQNRSPSMKLDDIIKGLSIASNNLDS